MQTFAKSVTPLLKDKGTGILQPYSRKKKFKKFVIDYEGGDIAIEGDDVSNIFYASVSQLPHCCGIDEIGDITVYERDTDYIKDNKEEFEQVLDTVLSQLLRRSKTYSRGDYIRKTIFVCNLIPENEGCILMREAFIRTGYFTLVKSFINSNSGNLVELWVSNI